MTVCVVCREEIQDVYPEEYDARAYYCACFPENPIEAPKALLTLIRHKYD